MPVQNEFNRAKRYVHGEKKDSFETYTPLFKGVLFLIIGFNYLFFAIKALGNGNVFCFMVSLLIFSAFVGAFVLLRRGEAHERLYENATYSYAPKLPLKIFAAALLSVAVSSSAFFLGAYGLFASITLGSSVLLGWYLYYGFDPTKNKLEGFESGKTAERILKLLITAKEDVATIKKVAKTLNTVELREDMLLMASGFERIIKHIETQPDDYEKARIYLISYLSELRQMSETYAALERGGQAASMEVSFSQALHETVEKLDEQYGKLHEDNKLNLDIQIAVLKKRLNSE